jgi:hypothetical protein
MDIFEVFLFFCFFLKVILKIEKNNFEVFFKKPKEKKMKIFSSKIKNIEISLKISPPAEKEQKHTKKERP